MTSSSRLKLLMSSVALCLPAIALAQSADTPADSASDSAVQDIIVTATRRATDLQRVPAVIQAVPAEQIKAFKIDGVLQLPSLVPGLVVAPSGGNNLYLRGIGSSSTGYNEAQTAVYIDGIYLPNPAMGIYSFNNIDRIEVLKGPQGTLYGRNVTAGLISVTTRDPGDIAKVDASLGYANYDTVTANFYGAAPLGDTLAFNTAVFYQKQSDGWTRNTFTGKDVQKSKELGIQSKLVWEPGPDTKVTGNFIYDYNNRTYGYASQSYPGTLATDGTPYLGKYRIASRVTPSAPFHAYIGALKIEQDLGFARLMSLTAYQTSNQDVIFPGGGAILGQPIAGQSANPTFFAQRNRTWSQELQLTSTSKDSPLDWVAGAFYYDDITKLRLEQSQTCVGTTCAPGVPLRVFGRPTTKSRSVYGDATYRLFDATRLTIGLRYTDETKRLSGLITPLPGRPNSVTALPPTVVTMPGLPYAGNPNGIPTKLHFKKLTYRVVLAQDLGEHVHSYISHNLGFKSGAFNGNSFTNPPVDPELLYATEAGIKSQWFDNRLRFNAAFFHYTYKNVQVRSLAPPATAGNPILLNVAKERVNGVDVDFAFVPTRGLTIQGAFEILDAKYADYPGATCISPGRGVVGGVTVGVPVVAICNLAGNRVAYAPPFSASLGATYKLETAAHGTFTFNVNDRFNTRYPLSGDHAVYQSQRHIVDASVAWLSADGHFDAQLWGRNLNGAYTYAAAVVSTNFSVTPGAPRTYGVSLGYHF